MDNRYFSLGCPALMQDGRFLTNYTRFNVVDQFVKKMNEINSAQTYRQFLQKNGDDFLNKERAYLVQNNTCSVNGQCLPISGKGKQNVLPCGTCYKNSS